MKEETFVRTGIRVFDEFFPRIKAFLEQDSLEMEIDGSRIRGYRSPDSRAIWIRDHSDILRGARYMERDMTSAVEHFAATQAANGRIFDYFTVFPDNLPGGRENWTRYVRVPVEADVEFRFVKAAWLAWQASGDDEWILRILLHLEKAVRYALSHPQRWDSKTGLVKRPYTIDTWDFAYTAGRKKGLEFRITDDTFWGIMHGDNSGYYEACRILGFLYGFFGDREKADSWDHRADAIKSAMNRVCWNGSFYTHFVKLSDVMIPEVDESSQLSLSNPMDINRGVADHDMAVSIIREYRKRRENSAGFAEWFSIDPPFPKGIFGAEKLGPGSYVNGGIMPLVGGELAKAAFDHGFEAYGVDILRQYFRMIEESGETYLWYFPDGSPSTVETSTSPEAMPTDGWGSSAMLYAFLEGLAGVGAEGKGFEKVRLSPRWPAAEVGKADVQLHYACSGQHFRYTFRSRDEGVFIDVVSPGSEVTFHVLLPGGFHAKGVFADDKSLFFADRTIEQSRYVDFVLSVKGKTRVEIRQ